MLNLPKLPRNLPSPWKEFLANLDSKLEVSVELHCLGGFAVSVAYGFDDFRPTGDIDYTAVIPSNRGEVLEELAGRGSALAVKHRVYLQRVGVGDVPVEYESRVIEVFGGMFSNLCLKVLDPYDLILSKLTRNYPIDQRDTQFLATACELRGKEFERRYHEELRPYIMTGPLERHDLTLRLWLEEYFSKGDQE